MTFLHPWAIWFGGAAAAAPVVVHLLTRPRPLRMPLSTLRFVREVVRQRRARHRLRDLLILALRTLAVLLLAAAVAQPQWGQQPLVSDRQAGDAVRVVILDVSQSMAATEGGIEAIERARTIAARFLRYRPGLRANLILAGATARRVFEEPSTNFEALRDELDRCRALPERLKIKPALELAARMLETAPGNGQQRRELVVVSDFQSANWRGSEADFSKLPADTQIQLEPPNPDRQPPDTDRPPPAPPNLAILGVDARTQSSQGGRVQLEVKVGNFTQVERKVTVEVAIGKATWRLEETCDAKRATTLSEEIELRQLGWQSGEARLVGVDDALAADNVRPFVVEIRPKSVYALLTRQPASQRPSSSHFLECALVPDAGLKERASATLRRIDPVDLDARALAPADLIVLDHPGRLSAEAIRLLAGLMRRGRPIIYVASETVDATNLKRLSQQAGGGLQLPVEFVPPPPGEIRRDLTLVSASRDNPPFNVFGENLDAITSRLRFAGGLSSRGLEGALKEEVLATYHDGSACMVLTKSDAGALAVINADLAASNLPRTPAFVLLLHELVQQMLNRDRADKSDLCGEPFSHPLPSEAGPKAALRILGPGAVDSGDTGGRFGELVDEGIGVTWRWPLPDRPGVYQVQRDDEIVFSTAVNIPAEESDLECRPEKTLKERLVRGQNMYYRPAAGEGDRRDDSWKWFAVACVACMLSEITVLLGFRT